MPYFVYRISPARELQHIDTLTRYQDARARVRALRESSANGERYRLIFAPQIGEAERLLSTPREERPIGED
jgi:hypothetical protein